MGVRIRPHDGEPITQVLRRFRKLVERHGVTYEMRAHRHYMKPSAKRHKKKCHDWFWKRHYSRMAEKRAHYG
jgi:small subunit ribosomal protein S21